VADEQGEKENSSWTIHPASFGGKIKKEKPVNGSNNRRARQSQRKRKEEDT